MAVGATTLSRLNQIGPAIDHYARFVLPHQQGDVAKVAARPDLDLAAGAEKGELDAPRS